jgi:hypothetical protein
MEESNRRLHGIAHAHLGSECMSCITRSLGHRVEAQYLHRQL